MDASIDTYINICERNALQQMMQRTATRCNTLQRTATHCNTSIGTDAYIATHINNISERDTLKYAATRCNALPTHCIALQHTTTPSNSLQHKHRHGCINSHAHQQHLRAQRTATHDATHCNALQRAATHCHTLQHRHRHGCVYSHAHQQHL